MDIILYCLLGIIVVLSAFIAATLYKRREKVSANNAKIHMNWTERKYVKYAEWDMTNVTSSIYLGNDRFYTDEDYEKYREQVLRKVDLVLKENE